MLNESLIQSWFSWTKTENNKTRNSINIINGIKPNIKSKIRRNNLGFS